MHSVATVMTPSPFRSRQLWITPPSVALRVWARLSYTTLGGNAPERFVRLNGLPSRRTLTSSVALADDVSVVPFLPFTWVWVNSAVSRDTPISRSFLFGVLITVLKTVFGGAVEELSGISVISDTFAANLEEAVWANAGVVPNVANIAATAKIGTKFFMALSFLSSVFQGLVDCSLGTVHFPFSSACFTSFFASFLRNIGILPTWPAHSLLGRHSERLPVLRSTILIVCQWHMTTVCNKSWMLTTFLSAYALLVRSLQYWERCFPRTTHRHRWAKRSGLRWRPSDRKFNRPVAGIL